MNSVLSAECRVLSLARFGARSRTLQRMLRAAGYVKGSGVSGAGISLVSRLARKHALRDWPDTRTVADYDSLIAAVELELRRRQKGAKA